MSRIGKIARRTFLVGSGVAVAGVAFGVYLVKRPIDNPLNEGLAEGAATFNPWVIIDADKVTLITPHADKGQGVLSAQAALIAEELDIEFGQFETSFGLPSNAYWNQAMGAEMVPFLATDESFGAEAARTVGQSVVKVIGLQGTGGSTAMPDSFDKLREAGAIARETLKAAAAKQTGIAVDELKTANGAVQLPDGSEIKYTQLAAIAAEIPVVDDVTLKDPSEWRLIGKPMERLDILAKSTGTLPYGIDRSMDGMVYAAVRTNPRKSGTIAGFDASEALARRGVASVIEVSGGIAAIADNTWRALKGVEAVEVDWGPEKAYPDEQATHWDITAESFTDERMDKMWRDEGKVDDVFADADIITAEYKVPYAAHAPLEPLNAICLVTDTQVEIWTGHQMPGQLLTVLADVTGHDKENVIFNNQFMGGSFGHRLEFEHIKQVAEIANTMRGTPVKLTYSREEDFAHDFPRQLALGRCSGVVESGAINALDVQLASPSVAGSQLSRIGMSMPGPDGTLPVGAWNNPYKFDNFRMCTFEVPGLAPVSSWRSVGAPAGGFIFDTFFDELCHAAELDPMEARLNAIDHDVSRKVLEAVAEMSNWGSDLGAGRARGVAFVESFGVPVAEVVEVSATDDGIKLDKVFVACDVGTVIDPINFENLVQGGVVFGLGHAMNCEITYSGGVADQTNYHAYEAMRIYQCPEIIVRGLENGTKVRGIGEPPVAPAAPALGNAIFAATGQRIREMPFNKHIDFA